MGGDRHDLKRYPLKKLICLWSFYLIVTENQIIAITCNKSGSLYHTSKNGGGRCCIPKNCSESLGPRLCEEADTDIICGPCPSGSYNDAIIPSSDMSVYENCKPHFKCAESHVLTKNGTSASNTECTCDISRGFYSEKPNTTPCTVLKCEVGKQLNEDGECDACPDLTFKDNENVHLCQPCQVCVNYTRRECTAELDADCTPEDTETVPELISTTPSFPVFNVRTSASVIAPEMESSTLAIIIVVVVLILGSIIVAVVVLCKRRSCASGAGHEREPMVQVNINHFGGNGNVEPNDNNEDEDNYSVKIEEDGALPNGNGATHARPPVVSSPIPNGLPVSNDRVDDDDYEITTEDDESNRKLTSQESDVELEQKKAQRIKDIDNMPYIEEKV